MEIFELVVALLSTIPEGINGRTVVQKLGYFASVMLRIDAEYEADYYGPFSAKVAEHLQNMVELEFVTERGRQTLRNRTMYTYSLTEDGLQLAKEVRQEYPKECALIENIVGQCGETAHCNYNILSWAAKVHFVVSRAGKSITREEAVEASRSFGWQLDEGEVESGIKLLSALNLIREE